MIIHDYRNFDLTENNPGIINKIYFKIISKTYNNLNKFNSIVAVSEFTKKTLIEQLNIVGSKITVVNNSFDCNKDIIHIAKHDLLHKHNIKIPINTKIILSVSSEEERKNIPDIIKAVALLEDDTIFIKIGKAIIKKNREKNNKLISDLDINNKVFFIDRVSYEDLINFYRISTVFIFPSSFEGFGRPPIEAQIYGLPVISSSIEVLKDNLLDSVMYIEHEKNHFDIMNNINNMLYDKKTQKFFIDKGLINCRRFDINVNYNKFYQVLK
jgi:glycosyltransferase involved in cell wall biosynthesis